MSSAGRLPQTASELEALPWCRALLTRPRITTFTPQSRDPENTNPHDRFFGKTLNHSEGIPACISFYPESSGKAVITELSTLFALSQGTDGYPGIAHGGMIAVLIDEVLGVLIQINMDTDRDDPVFKMNTVTSSMDIKYLKPITTPGVVLGVGQIKEIRGKRLHLRAIIKDSSGVNLATCDSVWIGIPRVKM
ncbi:versatile peroxidase VPL1 [Colletotrichum spaethianum]|uniref:Versatile peroxidase VPL1 n=1 Tax=Colletotrichum spaethianum TaxID=700344 RepID=A0AA37L297_9PEZI|nr:versatile peroxidase VPL1 [Colletotrichum spaethianum]GKT40646.1 versatile peroxidase VPL1 [Colletotrichum spaethianum]